MIFKMKEETKKKIEMIKNDKMQKKNNMDLDSLRYMFAWETMSYDEIPAFMKDNDYIQTGYRPLIQSYWLALSTIFRWHNETINIWTHFLGILTYFLLFLRVTVYKPANYTIVDCLMISIHCLINMMTFSFSSLFHILNCLEEKTYNLWSKLDYFGIALLISSSIITWVYFAFYTYDLSMIIYMVSTAMLGSLVGCLILTQNLNTPEKRFLRSVTFLIFGLLAVIPTFHYYLMDNCYKKSIPAMLMIGVFYVSGTMIYYLRIPERWTSNHTFDLIGSSHNIFHLSVIAGSLSHFYALYMLANQKTINCNGVHHLKSS